MPEFGLVGASYKSQSYRADCQRSMNLYPETVESGSGKAKVVLYGTPGLQTFTTLPTSPVRGLWPGEKRLFAVAGSKLYEVFSDGTYDELGDVGNDGKPAQIFPNGNQILIVSGGYAWCDSGSGPVKCKFTLPEITDLAIDGADNTKVSSAAAPFDSTDEGKLLTITSGTGFTPGDYTISSVDAGTHKATLSGAAGTVGSTGGHAIETTGDVTASQGAFLDGYFIVSAGWAKKEIYISALYDGTKWDANDQGVKQAYPDYITGILADHEELWIGGSESSTEVWRNTGNADFPFERDQGAVQHYGITAPWSMVRLENGVAWISADEGRGSPVAFHTSGFQARRVSTHAIEQEWSAYSTVSDAVAYSYLENGHAFWVISFPTANATWVYDATTQLWHERGYWTGSTWACVRGRYHCYVGIGTTTPAHYVGDYSTGVIYKQSATLYTDAGTAIHRRRTAPHIAGEMHRAFFSHLRLDCEDGINPTLCWSDSGGKAGTFTTPITGRTGNGYVDWWRLGSGRDRVFQLDITDNARVCLVNAYLDVTGGN